MNSVPPQKSSWQTLNRPEVSLLDETPRREERSALLGKVAEYLTVSVFVLTIIAYEWAHWYFHWTPKPLLFGVLGGTLVAYALIRIGLLMPRLKSINQETRAARSYTETLRQLSARGWYVFHNVKDPRGIIIGSVITGTAGVFAVTARHISRSGKEDFESTIVVGPDESITVNGAAQVVGQQPMAQARQASAALYGILAEAGLDTVGVQSVLVFPSWLIKIAPVSDAETDHASGDVWVFNETELVEKLNSLPPVLEPKKLIELCTLLEKIAQS